MAKIAIINNKDGYLFDGEQYIIDLSRRFEGYERGDIKCSVCPFIGINLTLEIAVRRDGSLIFRSWNMFPKDLVYSLETSDLNEEDAKKKNESHGSNFYIATIPTPEQVDTVNGLWSGRVRFEGLRLAVGDSLQRVCPINIKREEQLTGLDLTISPARRNEENITKIAIIKENCPPFDGEQYIVDLGRRSEERQDGDIDCSMMPFFGLNLALEVAIRRDGSIAFRKWDMSGKHLFYGLETSALNEEDAREKNKSHGSPVCKATIPTPEQIDTVNGLWSERIRFEGLKLYAGSSLQRICPIDVKREEQLTGRRIYLAY